MAKTHTTEELKKCDNVTLYVIYHLDNNETEAYLCSLCLHKHAWKVIDTIEGAKTNGLNPFRYIEYLLTKLMEHMDDTDRPFLDDLLPWLETLPDICQSGQEQ